MPVLTDVVSGVPRAVSLEQEQLYPIREVARLTGVNPVSYTHLTLPTNREV